MGIWRILFWSWCLGASVMRTDPSSLTGWICSHDTFLADLKNIWREEPDSHAIFGDPHISLWSIQLSTSLSVVYTFRGGLGVVVGPSEMRMGTQTFSATANVIRKEWEEGKKSASSQSPTTERIVVAGLAAL